MEVGKIFKKSFDVLSLFVMGILAPVTLAVLASANALPGDATYPLKLSLENMAIFVAQVRPQTEAELRLGVLDRRYREARMLMEDQASTRGDKYFTEAARVTRRAFLGIEDEDMREHYVEELTEDLRRYGSELEALIEELESP